MAVESLSGVGEMYRDDPSSFYRERVALVDEDSIDRALRIFLDRTGCAVEAGRALVQAFTVDLDMLARKMPDRSADLRPLPSLA